MLHVPVVCGTNNVLCVTIIEIPFSHINTNSLCCCKISRFIPTMAMHKLDYNLDQNTVVKKLSIIGVYRLLANFSSTPLLFLWIFVSSSLVISRHVHHSVLSNNVYRKLNPNLQIYNWDYFTYSCYTN